MKLAYHSLGSVDEGYGESRATGYPDALRAYLGEISRDDTEIDLYGTTRGGIASESRFFATQDGNDVLHNMMEAYRADYDGYVLGNVYDPGLREGRELLDVPVTGFTETTVLLSHAVADTSALLLLQDKVIPYVRDNLVSYRLDDRVFLRGADVSVDSVARAFTDDDLRESVVADFLDASHDCVEEGAELIIPGAGIISTLLNEEGIHEIDDVPIMDGVTTLVKTTELLVDLYDVDALATSKRRMYRPPDGEAFLDDLVETYLADR